MPCILDIFFFKFMKIKITSDISVRLLYGLKNIAIDLCDISNMRALRKRMPCTASISSGDELVLKSQLKFLPSENAVSHSS